MANPTKYPNLPQVKTCEVCGSEFARPANCQPCRWVKVVVCSHSCASRKGNALRWAEKASAEDRFWENVDKTPGHGPHGDCWPWTAGRTEGGYGRLSVGEGEEKAHRFSWTIHFGPIPDGDFVCHECDFPPCVRPEHLFLGDPDANMADMVAKGRSLTGERHPKAKLTDDDIRAIRADGRMQIELAEVYGVTQGLIGMIKRGEIWTHVT